MVHVYGQMFNPVQVMLERALPAYSCTRWMSFSARRVVRACRYVSVHACAKIPSVRTHGQRNPRIGGGMTFDCGCRDSFAWPHTNNTQTCIRNNDMDETYGVRVCVCVYVGMMLMAIHLSAKKVLMVSCQTKTARWRGIMKYVRAICLHTAPVARTDAAAQPLCFSTPTTNLRNSIYFIIQHQLGGSSYYCVCRRTSNCASRQHDWGVYLNDTRDTFLWYLCVCKIETFVVVCSQLYE